MVTQPTLKEQLIALCDQHGLNYISIAVYTLHDGERFIGASAHGDGFAASNNGTHDDAATAIGNAIAELNGKRHAQPDVPELVAA